MAEDPRLALARKYHLSGLDGEAWAMAQDLLTDSPSTATLLLAAEIGIERNEFVFVISYCDRILTTEPGNASAHFYRALALEKSGRLSEAHDAYRRSLDLRQDNAIAWNNLGNLLDQLGQSGKAVDAFRKAIDLSPDDPRPQSNLGVALMGQGLFSAAAETLTASLALDPDNAAARINLGAVDIERGYPERGLLHFDQALELDPNNRDASDNRLFALHYETEDPSLLWRAHRAWAQTVRQSPRGVKSSGERSRKLRLGYVSPDFRRHSVSFFSEPLLAAHDRKNFEIYCYSNTVVVDDVTARFKASADHWRDVQNLDTDEAATLIRNDGIDILVDLAGHTMGNRLDVFAVRAAPIQVTALGYPDTTGLTAIDARLCDGVTDPLGTADQYASERLMRLETGLHCYAAPADAPPVAALPCLKAGHVTFGSFNKLAKISQTTVSIWAKILTVVPNARLLLKSKALTEPATRERLTARFAAHGVAADRLELMGWSPGDRAHLELYAGVDIALDPTPYNGTTTTCEALWMGVPVITLAGRAHAGRVGSSLLTTIGCPENICATPEAYVRRAAALAAEPKVLVDVRKSLRQRVAASALCNAPAYARAVEAVYRSLWNA